MVFWRSEVKLLFLHMFGGRSREGIYCSGRKSIRHPTGQKILSDICASTSLCFAKLLTHKRR